MLVDVIAKLQNPQQKVPGLERRTDNWSDRDGNGSRDRYRVRAGTR